MLEFVLGNGITLIASSIMVYTGYVKNKSIILWLQIIQCLLFTISYIVLGGYSAAILSCLAIFRNVLCYYNKLNGWWLVLILITSGVLILSFNNEEGIWLIPLINFILYTSFINTKNIYLFKWIVLITLVLSAIYNFVIFAFVAVAFNIMSVVTNLISIYQLHYKNNNYIKSHL